MNMSIARASSIIDRHLEPDPSQLVQSKLPLVTTARTDFSGRDVTVRPTLPAFYVNWRGGPSPYDAHRGDYHASVDAVWESRQHFVLCDYAHEESFGKAAQVLKASQHPGNEIDVYPAHFRSTVHAEAVNINSRLPSVNGTCPTYISHTQSDIHTPVCPSTTQCARYSAQQSDDVWVCNPTKDRMQLEEEVMRERSQKFVTGLRVNRGKLYRRCVQIHPHGALGISETPYGNPGEVYKAHQRHMLNQLRDHRKLLGSVEIDADHLRGSIAYWEDPLVRGRTGLVPEDNLLGATYRRP